MGRKEVVKTFIFVPEKKCMGREIERGLGRRLCYGWQQTLNKKRCQLVQHKKGGKELVNGILNKGK